jgi:putative flavoprotein involved in K+ transport
MNTSQHFDTVVIGGGQAGLVTGHYLAKLGRQFVILDENEHVGDSWRLRWDALRLFTPAKFSRLPGLPLPLPNWSFATKDELADYLATYAERFDLDVRTGVHVDRLSRNGDSFVVLAGDQRIEADQIVVATGAFRTPYIPAFADDLAPGIVQFHSSAYRNPGQLQEGSVLIVGAGNSGAEIAFELRQTHRCLLAGRDIGHIPVKHGGRGARIVFPVVRFAGLHILNQRNPIGRNLGPKVALRPAPLARVKPRDLAAAGVERVPRVSSAMGGRPTLESGRVLDVANVIWCTGYRPDYRWIDLPVFDDEGAPRHHRGVVDEAPGLYFVGLEFQYALASDVIPGVGRDAEYVVKHLAARGPVARPAAAVGR